MGKKVNFEKLKKDFFFKFDFLFARKMTKFSFRRRNARLVILSVD